MFTRSKIKNGLRLITIPRAESLSVNLLVLVGAGTNFENEKNNGLSHFVEHMCFKGTSRRPRAMDISSELDALGAEYNAFTGREYTGYYVSCLPDKLDQALDILSDLYLNPVFDPNEIEKEKGVISEEINRAFDNPSRRVQDVFTELLYGGLAAGRSTLGTNGTLSQIKRQDFFTFRKKFYHAGNTVIVAAGNFDPKQIRSKITRSFKEITPGDDAAILPRVRVKQTKPACRVDYRQSEQSNLILGFRTFGEEHEKYYAATVLSSILGGTMSSRLWQRIREEMGAAYSIAAFQTAYLGYGYLAVAGGVQNSKLTDVIKAILAETSRLKAELVSEAELSRVKDSLIGSTYLGLETPSDLSLYYGLEEVRNRPLLKPEDWAKKIRQVSANDIMSLANEIFNLKTANLAILGPHENSKEFENILSES